MSIVQENVKKFLSLYKQKKIAIAVSGGSDSLALLYSIYEEMGNENIAVFHFNHGLRKEAEDEAKWLSNLCARMGIPCAVRYWKHQDDITKFDGLNMMQKARQARYGAMAEFCKEFNIDHVCVGHTSDDVAENFVMRLGRGSGLSGLASMRQSGDVLGVPVLRPVLECSRQDLKDYLTSRDQEWVSDPSNEKEAFLRVRVRRAKEAFSKIGLDFESISASATSLRRAEDALECWTEQLWDICVEEVSAKKLLITQEFWGFKEEMQLRILSKVMLHLTGDVLAPRTSKRQNLLRNMEQNPKGKWTLGGVIFENKNGVVTCVLENNPAVVRVEKMLNA